MTVYAIPATERSLRPAGDAYLEVDKPGTDLGRNSGQRLGGRGRVPR